MADPYTSSTRTRLRPSVVTWPGLVSRRRCGREQGQLIYACLLSTTLPLAWR